MSDLISRKALIEKAYYEEKGMAEPFASNFGVLVDWLANKIPTVESGEWIPCSERMPETHQSDFGGVFSGIIRSCKVLVTSESRDVFECRAVETMYSGLCWIDTNECQRDDIIAWMPLPEPYRG